MLPCDVMLRDVAESRRANQHIHRMTTMETLIVSRQFWPQFSSANGPAPTTASGTDHSQQQPQQNDPLFRVHREVKQAMDEFGGSYSKFKKPRKLLPKVSLNSLMTITFCRIEDIEAIEDIH